MEAMRRLIGRGSISLRISEFERLREAGLSRADVTRAIDDLVVRGHARITMGSLPIQVLGVVPEANDDGEGGAS
jgi:hypothetical protein